MLQERRRINERANNSAEERADLDALHAIADELDDEDLRCAVLMRRARLAFREYSATSEAFAPLERLRERAQKSGSLRWQAEADLAESMFYPLGLGAGRGLALARSALEAYRELGDETRRRRCARRDGADALRRGQNRREPPRVRRGVCDCRTLSAIMRLPSAPSGTSASNAQDAFERDAVVKWSARWLELTLKAGDRRCEADALGQSTWPLLWSPNFLDALPILERAAQICRECGLGPALLVNEMNVAEFGIKLGSFDAAIATFERADAGLCGRRAILYCSRARGASSCRSCYRKRGAGASGWAAKRSQMPARPRTFSSVRRRLQSLAEAEYAAGDLRSARSIISKKERRSAAHVARARGGALRCAFSRVLRASRRLRCRTHAR